MSDGAQIVTTVKERDALAERRASRAGSDGWKVWAPAVLLVLVGFAVAWMFLEDPPPKSGRLAVGSTGGAYWAYAERYREILARDGFDLELVETEGSLENLDLLRRDEVMLALVQGGTPSPGDAAQLESLASLFFEPVWLFHRVGLEIESLPELAGLRVAVGGEGSGTRALAEQMLAQNDLAAGMLERIDLGGAAAARALEAGEIDAAFFVAAITAPYVGELLRRGDIDLLSFARHRAYRYRLPFLSPVVLGEGVVDLAANVPPRDIELLAAGAGLAARPGLHKDLIPLLLGAMREVHGGGGLFEEPGRFPSTELVELPLDTEAKQYLLHGPSFLHRILPFRWAVLLDRMKILLLPFLTLLIPVFKIGPPLYRWRIRSKIYRWYDDLRLIDAILHETGEAMPDAELAEHMAVLRQLEKEVSTEVSVPLSYMDEYYRLRVHIELILAKLERMESRREAT